MSLKVIHHFEPTDVGYLGRAIYCITDTVESLHQPLPFRESCLGLVVFLSVKNVLTTAFEASEERTSALSEVLSASEPEPTAESRVPTSSSSLSRV